MALVAAAVVLWRPWVLPEATVAAGEPEEVSVVTVPDEGDEFALGENPRVLIFGDSWTYGSAATTPELGYAYVVAEVAGWTTVVDGIRGSGYQKQGFDGPDFGARMAELDAGIDPDLIIVQGSINDRRQDPEGYRPAVTRAWDVLESVYPDVPVIVLGPAPQVLPVEPATARIDEDLAALAAERGWPYVSPIADAWITDANYLDVIDTSDAGADHPSTEGHRYLAERLAEAVALIAG